MKKKIMLTSTLVLAVIVLLSLKACIKDSGTRMYSFYTPVLHTTAEVRASVKSDVAQPIVNAGKIYVKGNFIFMIEKEKGIHIIDNSNPSSPINKAFITIPGNEDLAVNGNIFYADCYTDLFAIDISNINNVTLKSYAANLYPERRYASGYYIDSNKIITDWIKHDTIVDASFSGNNYWYQGGIYFTSNPSMANASSAQSTTGTAGSMAKMAVINNRLYSVSSDNLLALNISDPSAPTFLSKNNLHLGIGTAETIYPFQDKLFIGSTSGMYIFSIADADNPTLLNDIQSNIFNRAKAYRDEHITKADSWDEFVKLLDEKGGFISAHWDGTDETEEKIKELTKATIRCIPVDNELENGVCILTGKPSVQRVLFARAY